MKKCCLKLLLFFYALILIISCNKQAKFLDMSERFPLEKVAPDVITRANEFAKSKDCQIDFLQSSTVDRYTLRVIINRAFQKAPSVEELDKLKAGEMFDLAKSIKKEIFLGQPWGMYKCLLVVITIVYYDNAAGFAFSE